MTKKKSLVLSIITSGLVLVVLRFLVLPAQLSKTPYHDATLGEDLMRVFFLQIPAWIFAVSFGVMVVAFLVSRKKEPIQPPQTTTGSRAPGRV